MKRVLSTVIAVVLLLGLGALAVMALPSASAPMTASALAAPLPQEPDAAAAPAAFTGPRYNHIALPLTTGTLITPFTAQGLLNYIGPSATQVVNLNAASQGLDFWDRSGSGLINGVLISNPALYPLELGHPYLVLIDSTLPVDKKFSIVGGVPDAGAITFTLEGTSPSCSYNEIMVPLDQYWQNVTNAAELATSIGNVEYVAALWETEQTLDFWDVASGSGLVNGVLTSNPADFPVQLGYPYFVCVSAAGDGDIWP